MDNINGLNLWLVITAFAVGIPLAFMTVAVLIEAVEFVHAVAEEFFKRLTNIALARIRGGSTQTRTEREKILPREAHHETTD